MDNEQPHQELVKCVVVGDTAVGKTRLICARACNKRVSLAQLLTTHVPTVWAIDQYRIYKDVLEQSWEVVDGVNVSLRLWDTFGDHEKDRRFAYGRSDVVLLCFSITNPVSLRNCQAMWFPEIRRFCPQTPVLLVGCKNDLRYMYRDEAYLRFFRDRSPFVRATRKADLVMPDEARAVARDLGIYYYETSVLTHFGVNEVFENAIRAALMARRQQRFWMTNLKKVQRPLLQAPFRPPPPPRCEITVVPSMFEDHMTVLMAQKAHTDVVFVAGSVGFVAHRFLLAAASPSLERLLCSAEPPCELLGARSSSEASLVSTFGESATGDFNDDTELLIDNNNRQPASRLWDLSKRRSSCQVFPSSLLQPLQRGTVNRELNHPAFQAIRVEQCEERRREGNRCGSSIGSITQTIITLTKLVTPLAMQQCLQFLYTGTIDTEKLCELAEIRLAAEFMELSELQMFVTNIQAHEEEFLNSNLRQQYRKVIRSRLRTLCLGHGLFSDVQFKLDDGTVSAHKALLMARCDVMRAMFAGDFRESAAKVVEFPGVKEEAFSQLLYFLYTDEVPPGLNRSRCLEVLELANRLCLPRLTQLVEARIVREMQRAASDTAATADDVTECCLRLLEPCKLHNADQLADWCMNHLCTNYNRICKGSPRLLKALHPENQAYLSENRWPPVWYLKDYDYYQKCMMEREKEERPPRKSLKRSRHNSGCLCFTGKSRRDSDKPLVSSV